MELLARNRSIAEVRATNTKLTWALVGSLLCLLLAMVKLVTQSEIVIQETPGMPDHAVIEKTALDKGTQRATLVAVTSAIAQVNPSNVEYQKAFLQSFLSPAAYTKVSREINDQAARLAEQHELGSYYFVFKSYDFDPALAKHFVVGDVHTVNAAHDTAQAYVFEYQVHVENYRLLVDEVSSYAGEHPHDSEWIRGHQK